MIKDPLRNFSLFVLSLIAFTACQEAPKQTGGGLPASLGEVPAVRLNYRYEPDVPAPTEAAKTVAAEQIDPAIRLDFEQNRSQETVGRIIASPNGKRALVAYNRPTDQPDDFRLDMYSSDGVFLRKVSSDLMAVHFPDTISWAPDSSAVAFVAMLRTASVADVTEPVERPVDEPGVIDATGADTNSNTAAVPASPTPAAPVGILLFRTEQMYITDAEGSNTRPLTQNESLIYYYYEWSPDSTMLATLAATYAEWRYLKAEAERRSETFVPQGRPRIVEKNGRERLVDDALTAIQPVWSPDSSKIACAFDKQIRIYDSVGTVPTQAAIPLRNNLLFSSKAYDTEQARSMGQANAAPQNNDATNTADPATGERLPDESTLVSFNPIVALHWPSPDLLYFQTAFVKRMLNEADSVSSFPRWHRLIFTPQGRAN